MGAGGRLQRPKLKFKNEKLKILIVVFPF